MDNVLRISSFTLKLLIVIDAFPIGTGFRVRVGKELFEELTSTEHSAAQATNHTA